MVAAYCDNNNRQRAGEKFEKIVIEEVRKGFWYVNNFDKIVMKLTNGKENGVTMTYFSLYLPNEEGELVMISSHGSPGIKKPQWDI